MFLSCSRREDGFVSDSGQTHSIAKYIRLSSGFLSQLSSGRCSEVFLRARLFTVMGSNRNMQASHLVLDITGVSTEPLLTGVQRISRGLAEGLEGQCRFVRYSKSTGDFHLLSGLPRLASRKDGVLAKYFRRQLRALLELGVGRVRSHRSLARFVPPVINDWVWRLYVQDLSDWTVADPSVTESAQPWKPAPRDHLVVAEIPRSQEHVEALRAAISKSGKTSFYLHDIIPVTAPELIPSLSRTGVRGLFLGYLDVVMLADEVICNSAVTKKTFDDFKRLFPKAAEQLTRVVYPPKRTELSSIFRDDIPPSDRPLEKVKALKPSTQVLFVGNLGTRKNLETVLRAIHNSVAKRESILLHVVAGSGREVDPAVAQLLANASPAQAAALVHHSNMSDEALWNLFEEADVLVIPSRNEGLGLPVLEAASKGVPIVASRIPIFEELSQFVNMTLVDPDDVHGWEMAILGRKKKQSPWKKGGDGVFPDNWPAFAEKILLEAQF